MSKTIAAASLAVLMAPALALAQASVSNKPACAMPKASDAAEVVLLGTSQTEALSSVALGLQSEVTGFGTVNVEAGKERLHVVIVSDRPTIWRFTGATGRVERAAVISSGSDLAKKAHNPLPRAGVVGLPADRVSFPRGADCPNYFFAVPSPGSAHAAAAVKVATGKSPAVIAARYRMTAFDVPSGKIEATGIGGQQIQVTQGNGTFILESDGARTSMIKRDGNLDHEFHLFNPAGVVSVDAKKVVAAAPVAPYVVLPEEAGLAQLVKAGALTRGRGSEFLIGKKIRFPAGLSGFHTVKFVLRTGVSKPDGDPGDSAVLWEGTGLRVDLP